MSEKPVTEEVRKEIEGLLPGTSGHYDRIIREDYGLDDCQIEETMRELGHFSCANCGWWCEESEENDIDGNSVCDDCHEDSEEE